MFFRNHEVIELSGGKKHIVAENTIYEDNYYYMIYEVDIDDDKVMNERKIITAVSENGHLFVKTITGDLEKKLIKIIDEKLGLKD